MGFADRGADGRTSPEELLAAAHSSCFAMALSGTLVRGGAPGDHLHVSATVTFDKVGDAWTITRSELDVVGVVPGLDEAAFEAAGRGRRRTVPDLARPCGQRRAVGECGARGLARLSPARPA